MCIVCQKQTRSLTLVTMNCNPLCLFLNQNTKFLDIMKLIQIGWKRKEQFIRIFKIDGKEVQESDLIKLKKGSILYAELSNLDINPNIQEEQYDIIKKIGEGGQGIVLLGRNKITKELVALKKIKNTTWPNQEMNGIITQEQLILKVLDHKNIVKLHQSYETHDQREITMVMEYLNGGSLIKEANSQLTEEEVKLYSKQIVDAIAYCHQKNIVHCDLKLENIMLASPNSKKIKIIDFGVSSYAGQEKQPDRIIGTLDYIAPEVLSSTYINIQKPQDVWAIGCIIYGLVFGRLPFDGNNPSVTFRNIVQCNYNIPKIPITKDLIDLLSQIFVKNPLKRANIFDIQTHSWFKEKPKLQKLNSTKKNGRSSSVYTLSPNRESQEILVFGQKKTVSRRSSVTRFDKQSIVYKIKQK